LSAQRPNIEPLRPEFTLDCLDGEQLDKLTEGTLHILEEVGVRFPSEVAMNIFADHGASVDRETKIVKMSPDLVRKVISTDPRYFIPGAMDPGYDLMLAKNVSYFTTDGYGYETIDFFTGSETTF
jgi:trimethylamine--corrinoid protein Co-methyltransferase